MAAFIGLNAPDTSPAENLTYDRQGLLQYVEYPNRQRLTFDYDGTSPPATMIA